MRSFCCCFRLAGVTRALFLCHRSGMKTLVMLSLFVAAAPSLASDDEIVLEESDDEIVLEESPLAAPAKPAFVPSTRLNVSSETGLSADSSHERAGTGSPEDVIEAWSLLRLALRHQTAPGRSWRFGARARLWGGWDHPDEGGASKTLLLTELTELRYDRRLGRDLVLQLGLQKIDWSVTDGMGPSLMFAPRDLRFGLSVDPDDSLLPVEAALLRLALSHVHDSYLELAFVPRHRPAELRLFGTDWGLMSSGQAGALPVGDIAWAIDPSVEDHWQNNLMYFARPELRPEDFSGAVRLRGRLKGTEVGLWGFYGFDLFPELRMDPDLAAVLALLTSMDERPLLEQISLDQLAGLEAFQSKMAQARASGDSSRLITSVFHRLAQIGAQARRGFGRFVVAIETAWTPRFLGGRTLFDGAMQPLSGLATAHTALQLEYQSPPDLIVVVGVSDFWVPDVANQPLMLLDSGLIKAGQLERPFDPTSAHLLTANLAIKAEFGERFDAMIAAVSHPFQRDWMLMPSLTYKLDDTRQQLRLAGEFFGGPSDSMFGLFGQNDRVLLSYKRRY